MEEENKTATQESPPVVVKQRRGKERHPASLANLAKGMWKPGQSGNPAGPRPGAKKISNLIREYLDQKHPDDKDGRTWAEKIAIATMELAIKGNGVALREVFDRLEGKVPLPLHHGGTNGGPIELDMTNAHEKLLDHMRRYNKAKERRKLRAGNPPLQKR